MSPAASPRLRAGRRTVVGAALAALSLLAGACGSDSDADDEGAQPPSKAAATLTIQDFTFSPDPLVVAKGTRVTVTNEDEAAHTATADDKSFDTGNLAKGQTAEITLSEPGEVPYFCSIHDYMRGVIRVRE